MAARPARLDIGADTSAVDVSATPTAYPPESLQGKLPSNGLQTDTTSGMLDTSSTADIAQAATLDHTVGKDTDIVTCLFSHAVVAKIVAWLEC